ncbi:MAG TPA: T9SS type A sorting domain-containing protein, partial [Bacteroidia bacterium]|nr:T9SS type A sorting domain-containing protein [Bacteroidia bacterium]
MKKILFLLLLVCFFKPSFSQNINLSNSPYWDGECYLAVNPKNPKHLVTAWMYFSLTNLENAMATRSSFDGGKTWSTLQILPHAHPKFTCADPSIYFGKDSCVYLAYIDLSGLSTKDSGYDMVTRSVNGGITWRAPIKAIAWKDAANMPIDRPWIAADGSNGAYSGRVYLTSMNAFFTPQPHHPWFTYSSDSGSTWSPIKQLDDSIPAGTINEPAAFTTVSANGTLYATYPSYYTKYSPYARLVLTKSFNGGATFTPYIVYKYTAADIVPAADSLLNLGICISSNPADTSNLVIAATANHFGEPDIISYNTHDAGKTWSSPVRLNDDIVGVHDTDHDMVWGSFANNGTYAAVWRDRRNTSKGDSAAFQIYGTISKDGGNTYTSNFLISDTISPPIYLVRGNDFLGCAVTDSNVYADWSDMRTGKEETFFNSTYINKIGTGINSVSDNPAIKVDVYPNPFHNETTIMIHTVQSLNNSTLLVFSMNGEKVKELPIGEGTMHTIRVNMLTTGTYIWSLMQ